MFIKITTENQLAAGARLKHKDEKEYLELGEFSEADNKFFVFPEGSTGSFSKHDNIGFGVSVETLIADYLIEDVDGGFAQDGEGSVKGYY